MAEKFCLSNPNLTDEDHLYHIALSTSDNLPQRFGDVKYVCMGGKERRMQKFAELLYDTLGKPKNSELTEQPTPGHRLKNISQSGGRYCFYKVGPVAIVNHGIGNPSLSVVLNEMLKLIHHAGCTDVSFFRIGTSGGLGMKPGTVIITKQAYNGLLENCYRQVICGKEIRYPADTNPQLAEDLLKCAKDFKIEAIAGNTMGTNDFFEEQARLDGAFCEFSRQEKSDFLKRAHDEFGIRNFEMESCCFSGLCARANLKCAIVCTTVVNRLERDDVTADKSLLEEWEFYPQQLVAEYIKRSC
uniref:Uridine phosphorylase 2 n=1 Tax=Phallusia mammillata TaxID=59560 RepID=A0A6F9DVQ4_9ASCI|nr:uridine phosphorylase 2 [Phallusia mammillata]